MKHLSPASLLLPLGALLFTGVAGPRAEDAGPVQAPAAAARDAPVSARVPSLGPLRYEPGLGRFVAPYGDGRAVLSLDARLQARLVQTLEQNAVPWGATVLLEPATGRVLAMAEHSRAEPGRTGLSLTPLAPAASIFKLITTAALLEQGVSPGDEVCFHGGTHRLQPRLLSDDPRRDRRCVTLESAFGKSLNVVFAKLADRGLDPEALRAMAGRFLFNEAIPFAEPVAVSPARIDDDPFELANTAAGFGPVRLSALHAALLAAIVANGGVFVPPVLVDEVEGGSAPQCPAPHRVIDANVAEALTTMMRSTVTDGTARRAFRRAAGSLRGVAVAGKTGSLSEPAPFRDYSWFVGFAPADHPEVAVATVIVNERLWRVRAPAVARDALEAYFSGPRLARAHFQTGPRIARAVVP